MCFKKEQPAEPLFSAVERKAHEQRLDGQTKGILSMLTDGQKAALECPGKEDNQIAHPKHYNAGTIECIDVIEDWNLPYHLGCLLKYISRYRYKHPDNPQLQLRDLRKGQWYLERYINVLQGEEK